MILHFSWSWGYLGPFDILDIKVALHFGALHFLREPLLRDLSISTRTQLICKLANLFLFRLGFLRSRFAEAKKITTYLYIFNVPYQTQKKASFELAFLLLCKNTSLIIMQSFQGLLSWTRSDNPICIDTLWSESGLQRRTYFYKLERNTSLKKLTCSRNSIQLNSPTTAQVAAVVAPSTFSSRKRVTFITLPFAYLSWILDQVQPFWSWSLPEGASSSFPWDQEAFQRNWTRKKEGEKGIY